MRTLEHSEVQYQKLAVEASKWRVWFCLVLGNDDRSICSVTDQRPDVGIQRRKLVPPFKIPFPVGGEGDCV